MERKLALVTGASAGIGEAFARLLAARGFDLALTARRARPLESLAAALRQAHGVRAYVMPDDLVDPRTPGRLLDSLDADGRHVDVLINNAGYGLTGTYAGTSWDDQAAFMQVMMTAPSELAHRVLPAMRAAGYGRIVNVASLAGMLPGSGGHTLYAAVKAYMIKFSQSLHIETLGTGVHASALCPGLTFSEFHDANGTREQMNRTPNFLWMTSEAVAAAGWAAVEDNRPICLPGAQNKLIAGFARAIPESWALALMASQGARYRKV